MPPYIILSSYKYDGSNEVTSLPWINGGNRQNTWRVGRIEKCTGKENERVTPAGVARLIEILITAAPVNEQIRGSCRGPTNCMSCLKLATDYDRVQETSCCEFVSTSEVERENRKRFLGKIDRSELQWRPTAVREFA